MALAAGSHQLGPDHGSLEVRTYREGVAQRVGHDLIIDVERWQATVEVDEQGTVTAASLEADPRSLRVREGHRGVKPLTDKDRDEIRKNIEQKVLGTNPIRFSSDAVDSAGGLTVRGTLSIAGSERPASFELELSDDGRVHGTLPVVQSEHGIKPFRALMGALKVRDDVGVVLDVRLPTA